jgi:hypothetical protein
MIMFQSDWFIEAEGFSTMDSDIPIEMNCVVFVAKMAKRR